jgi:eukaryotic-like serine/threonine-protein kinase
MSNAESMVGAVLSGKWRLIKLLGEGGMGAVFSAEGLQGQGQRAIKVLHPEFVSEPQILDRFLNEGYAAQHLQHPNVAKVYEHGQAEDGTPYLVMELLQGIPLAEYVQPGKVVPAGQAAPIIFGVLQALSAAHAHNIIHRDLKPDNIFLVPDPTGRYTVKVLDFGIAKVMDAAGGMGSKTRTGVLLGTPGYMSPEQIKNAKSVDHRCDLWSAGIIFYEMLTGAQAFDAPNDFARLTAVLTQDPKPITSVAPQLAVWQDFFSRAIAREVDRRYANADEMARALITTARTQAGAAVLPTAEFGTVAVQQALAATAATPGQQPVQKRADGSTHVSAQLPEGLPSIRSQPPSVQVLPNSLGSTLKSSPADLAEIASLRSRLTGRGVQPIMVGAIAVACLLVGIAAGLLAGFLLFGR